MYKKLLPECVNFLPSPKAEKGEDYGIEYVVLEESNSDRLTVVARGVSPAINDEWEVYEIDAVEDLFWRVPEPGGGDWTHYEVHVYYPGTDPTALVEFMRSLREDEFPAEPVEDSEGETFRVPAEKLEEFISRAEDYGLIVEPGA